MDKTAKELLENSSHMDWLTSSQKMLVEAMMESYHDLKMESQSSFTKDEYIAIHTDVGHVIKCCMLTSKDFETRDSVLNKIKF